MRGDSRAKLAIAFGQLLQEKPYNKITVNDIVDRCGVHRNTFYYYFSDIPAILSYTAQFQLDAVCSNYEGFDSVSECILPIIDFLKLNQKAVLNIYNSMSKELLLEFLRDNAGRIVTRYLDALSKGRKMDEEKSSMLVNFFASALCGNVMDWMHRRMDYDLMAEVNWVAVAFDKPSQRVFERLFEENKENS